MFTSPHRRYNPLTGEWVLVSPQRTSRPWLGQVEKSPAASLPAYDPACYLCPGNERAGGVHNPNYTGTFIFDNDFPALQPDPLEAVFESDHELFTAVPERGLCRVVCFSPRHDLTLPELPLVQVQEVVRMWQHQTAELGGVEDIAYVQVFENKGAQMGASNPHPHNQIWATSRLPVEPEKELRAQNNYQVEHGTCLVCDYLRLETRNAERLVASNPQFTALVPFWAVWPFEVLVIANRHCESLLDLDDSEVAGLADILHQVTVRYDNLFEVSFPYSMGFHQAPFDGVEQPEWILHAHFYPSLLRSSTVRKFMVGYEMLAMPQRDITPETAAERLRSVSEVHYKQR